MSSPLADLTKMKVIDLRKELKTRGLSSSGDKAELITRLQAAMSEDSHDDNGDLTLDSDEIDSDGVLDEDDKSHHDDILDDDEAAAELNEEIALMEHSPAEIPSETTAEKPSRTLKRKITPKDSSDGDKDRKVTAKKIVLNRAVSVSSTTTTPAAETPKAAENPKAAVTAPTPAVELTETNKVKITATIDVKSKMEMRAKRFGLPETLTDAQRKEARKERFGQTLSTTSSVLGSSGVDNIDKLKLRAERFGQSVSKFMTDIVNKEKLEKRKAKFGTVK